MEKYSRQILYTKYYLKWEEIQFCCKTKNEKILNETNLKAFSNLFNILERDQDDLIIGVSIEIIIFKKI